MSSTHRVTLADDVWTNVSGGNSACTVIKGDQPVRLVVGPGDTQPEADTPDYVLVDELGKFTAEDLAGDGVWIRSESGEAEITVLRGPARIAMTAG